MHGRPQPSAWDGRSRAKREHGTGRCGKQQEGRSGNGIFMFIQCLVSYNVPRNNGALGDSERKFSEHGLAIFSCRTSRCQKGPKETSFPGSDCLPNPLSLGLPCTATTCSSPFTFCGEENPPVSQEWEGTDGPVLPTLSGRWTINLTWMMSEHLWTILSLQVEVPVGNLHFIWIANSWK